MSKVIITGSTGMIGKGVLLECLDNPTIEEVLVINRNSVGVQHEKLKEVLLKDFLQIGTLKDQLGGYDACFHCMGVSAVGMKEEDYYRLTYSVTEAFVEVLHELNPRMLFIYVSGTGTDGTETSRVMWMRVKGKTENMVFQKGFGDAYAFRPGAIIPERGIRSRTRWYNVMYDIMRPLFPLFKRSKQVTTTTKLGWAMIKLINAPAEDKVLENPRINELAG